VIGCCQRLPLLLQLPLQQLLQPPPLLQTVQHLTLCALSLVACQHPLHLVARLAHQQMQQALQTSPKVLP
jgi:hypothetical protein